MARLKDRNKQIPHGLKFLVPATKWAPYPYSSFETIVRTLIEHRRANPALAKQYSWSLNYDTVCGEVDDYNAAICKAHGWTDFIVEAASAEGTDLPKLIAHSSSRVVGRLAVGAAVIKEMFGADGPITDKAVASSRASVCVSCPNNKQGDWTSYFTEPAQAFIKKALGAIKSMSLETDLDSELHVCSACACPLKMKVWARTEHILKHIPPEDKAALAPGCWILQ